MGDVMNEPASPKQSLIQVAFPHQATAVFGTAIGVGILLIALPLLIAHDASRGDLLICAGVAIVLAAFGGQATVQIGGIIMAGAAGISIGLFIYLQSVKKDYYVRGSISGINATNYDVALKTRNKILGSISPVGTNLSRSRYDFVVFKSEIDAESVEVLVGIKGGNIERGNDKVARIASDHFEKYFGTNRRLDWELKPRVAEDRIEFEIFDNTSQKIISAEQVAIARPTTKAAWTIDREIPHRLLLAGVIGVAHAEEPVTREQFDQLLKQLKSDDTTTRRSARDALANLPVANVPTLMNALRAELNIYRIKLGITVGLSDMVRREKGREPGISRHLSEDDLKLLLNLAGDPDRTVRIYATQFLTDLGDPRQVRLGVEKASGGSDDKAVHNQLLSIQKSIEKVPSNERIEINRSLESIKNKSEPSTKILIDKIQQIAR